ncbi:MAG TPA: hypothetical protein ENN45_02405 [Bacteroidetes bacterium]|nr:hypothetical protein [Bacteroidota bacterium]
MSKIVILSAQLKSPYIMNDLLQQVSREYSEIITFFQEKFRYVDVITECADKTLNRLAEQNGIRRDSKIEDYNGNSSGSFNNQPILGSLKTNALPKGMGVIVDAQGKIIFVGDNYQSGWKTEIGRLQKLFTDAFIAETTLAILSIIGYGAKISSQVVDGKPAYQVEGVKL